MSQQPRVIYCAGPHTEPVALYAVTPAPGMPEPRDPRAMCGECAHIYAEATAEPRTIEGPDGHPIPNPDWAPPGRPPTLDAVTRIKRRRVPDWTPARDNYGGPRR